MKKLIEQTKRFTRRNSPEVLASVAASGVLMTGYLAARAGYKAAQRIQMVEANRNRELDLKEKMEVVWQYYIPSTTIGAFTIGAILTSNRISSKRAAAFAAAYTVSEQAFQEYQGKVVDLIGEKKEQGVRDEIASEKVQQQPPKEILITGAGTVLCCELRSMRYFESDMETLRRAQNQVNHKLLAHDAAYLADFYDLIGLEHTSDAYEFGWTSVKLMELEFSTALSPDDRPCMTFEYNYCRPLTA